MKGSNSMLKIIIHNTYLNNAVFHDQKLCIVQVLAVSKKAVFLAVLYVQNILQ